MSTKERWKLEARQRRLLRKRWEISGWSCSVLYCFMTCKYCGHEVRVSVRLDDDKRALIQNESTYREFACPTRPGPCERFGASSYREWHYPEADQAWDSPPEINGWG